ncbi:MAG: cryptochrome/photolyase family protein [Sphingobacterium sp.]
MKNKVAIFWFRRDLRLEDNVGLYHALTCDTPVLPVFIFDTTILKKLENNEDRRVDYIHQVILSMNTQLRAFNTQIYTFHGRPLEVFKELTQKYDIKDVFSNRDYEPDAIERDTEIYAFLKRKNITFKAFRDQVIFDQNDVLKNDGKPYTVYTPYSRKWKERLRLDHYKSYNPDYGNFFEQDFTEIHSLNEIGFRKTEITFVPPELDSSIVDKYDRIRDYPAIQGTTQLGIALRFGTISIRKCVAFALDHNQTWLKELIWREFFMQIVYHFPKVIKQSFKIKYDNIKWRNNEWEFEQWCEGKTGYPIVDAGMRQLNLTGDMHNRVRMIAASFLCKHLLIDWRWGEAYFAQKLNDYDLAANNGNWQWAAGSGCDSAPYFRIFNPSIQTDKFDEKLIYIKNWLPEFGTEAYPQPMVDHIFARERALKTYGEAVKDN